MRIADDDPRVRARRAHHPHRHRPVQPRSPGRVRGGRRAPAALAAGAGVPSAFATVTPPALFLFEPHQPELCNFTPTTFVDITAVMDAKLAAMAEMKAQQLPPDLLRRARRAPRQPRPPLLGQRGDPPGRGVSAGHAAGGRASCERRSTTELAELGSATVYEAGGRARLRRRRSHPGRSRLARGRARRGPCAAARTTT